MADSLCAEKRALSAESVMMLPLLPEEALGRAMVARPRATLPALEQLPDASGSSALRLLPLTTVLVI